MLRRRLVKCIGAAAPQALRCSVDRQYKQLYQPAQITVTLPCYSPSLHSLPAAHSYICAGENISKCSYFLFIAFLLLLCCAAIPILLYKLPTQVYSPRNASGTASSSILNSFKFPTQMNMCRC